MENKETTGKDTPESDGNLMKKFTKSASPDEIKDTADKIIEADPDIDKKKLNDKADQFHMEKKDDAEKQAENDAQFEQPKPDGANS